MIDKATQSDDNDDDDTNFWLATPGFGESLIEAEVDYAAGRTFSGDEIRDHFGLPPREATRTKSRRTRASVESRREERTCPVPAERTIGGSAPGAGTTIRSLGFCCKRARSEYFGFKAKHSDKGYQAHSSASVSTP